MEESGRSIPWPWIAFEVLLYGMFLTFLGYAISDDDGLIGILILGPITLGPAVAFTGMRLKAKRKRALERPRS